MATKEALKELFAKVQKEKQTKPSYNDDRFLTFKIGETYTLRLLYSVSDDSDRTSPFIEQKVHKFYNRNLKELTKVVCNSSPYLSGYEGYKNCPVCQAAAELYPQAKAGDKKAEAAYNVLKSSPENYAVVYVVNDSTDDETNAAGTVKIIRYGFEIQKFFDLYIMGKEVKGSRPVPKDEQVGYEAFDLENGRNILVTVSGKKVGENTFPSYSLAFSTKLTPVDLTDKEVAKAFKTLKFDEDFYKDSDEEAIQSFYNEHVAFSKPKKLDVLEDEDEEEDSLDEVDEVATKKASKKVVVEEDDFDDFDDEEEEEVVKPKKAPKKEKVVVEEDDDFEDFDEAPTPPKKKPTKKPIVEDDDDDFFFDDED